MVLSPEHPYIDQYKDEIKNWDEVCAYREMAARKSDFERSELAKDKTGVMIDGLSAVNPVNGKEIPIWISDYVLMSYGTGAIMAVPAHDERDWEFAKKFKHADHRGCCRRRRTETKFTPTLQRELLSTPVPERTFRCGSKKKKILEWLEREPRWKAKNNYKLRDWVFSRQRYWGEPIPIVHCPECGAVPVPEEELPLRLPDVDSYEPTGTGESPLAGIEEWVNCKCPVCGKDAKRETNTMPQWAGSSWYYIRYTDPKNKEALASKEAMKYWLPVDWYNGGMEHTTLHLLYSRFWHKFLYDQA